MIIAKERLRKAYSGSVSVKETCRKLRISKMTLYTHLKKRGIPLKGRVRKVSIDEKILKALYYEFTIHEVCEKLNITKPTLYFYIRKYGVVYKGHNF